MATGFQSEQARTRANAHSPYYSVCVCVCVAEYMDAVNTVNILYISSPFFFMANIFFQMLKSFKWHESGEFVQVGFFFSLCMVLVIGSIKIFI